MPETTRLQIRHITSYSFDEQAHYALQRLRLIPRSGHGQKVLQWSATISGGHKQLMFDDQFGNHTELVKADDGARHIEIVSEGVVEIADQNGIIGPHSGYVPLWLFQQSTPLTNPGTALRQLARSVRTDADEGDALAQLHALSESIRTLVSYETGRTDSETTAEEALVAGHGVCQDHSHIMIAGARLLDHPARYVSGYLLIDGQIDQEATHAWCEVWTESLGWVGFDVSNGISPDGRYVRVATGRDYRDAAPITGVRMGSGAESLHVALQVQQ